MCYSLSQFSLSHNCHKYFYSWATSLHAFHNSVRSHDGRLFVSCVLGQILSVNVAFHIAYCVRCRRAVQSSRSVTEPNIMCTELTRKKSVHYIRFINVKEVDTCFAQVDRKLARFVSCFAHFSMYSLRGLYISMAGFQVLSWYTTLVAQHPQWQQSFELILVWMYLSVHTTALRSFLRRITVRLCWRIDNPATAGLPDNIQCLVARAQPGLPDQCLVWCCWQGAFNCNR